MPPGGICPTRWKCAEKCPISGNVITIVRSELLSWFIPLVGLCPHEPSIHMVKLVAKIGESVKVGRVLTAHGEEIAYPWAVLRHDVTAIGLLTFRALLMA
ncbi:hypothetical protein GCM10028816_34600 [Spirosoma lituiforme]